MTQPLKALILSTSLNPNSKSRRIAQVIRQQLEKAGAHTEWLDLQEHDLPFCGQAGTSQQALVLDMRAMVERADAIVLAAPIYNYDVNAAAKNFIELTGRTWTGKVVALAVAAGGQRSGMAPMGIINSLMLDFRCIVLPRYVYASRGDYTEDGEPGEATQERIGELSQELMRVGSALRG